MGTLEKLKRLRAEEAKKLKEENLKLGELRKLNAEEQKVIQDIKRIRKARMAYKQARRAKAEREISMIKKGAKKVGSKVLDYLYAIKNQ